MSRAQCECPQNQGQFIECGTRDQFHNPIYCALRFREKGHVFSVCEDKMLLRIGLLLVGLYVWSVVMENNLEFEFELPDLPQLVSLVNTESESEGELNMTSLDKTIQPEDFGSEFR